MEKMKYISNFEINDGVTEVFLYDTIGFDGIDGRQFAYELKFLVEYHEPKVKRVKVRINSVGGSVIDAFSIFSTIYDINKKGKVVISTHNDGIAASAAGFVLLAGGKNIYPKDYSRLMLHGVSLKNADGTPAENVKKSDEMAMQVMSEMITEIFVKNSKVPESRIKEILSSGEDIWFTTEEAAKEGFFPSENIEKTGLDLPAKNDALLIANAAQKIISNNLNINIKKPLKMKRLANLLNLQEGSNEEVIANAISKTIGDAAKQAKKITDVQNTLKEKNTLIEKLQGQVKAANKLTAVNIVDAAIKDGRLAPADEDAKKEIVNQAEKDLDAFQTMLKMIPVKAANILTATQAGKEGGETLIAKIENRSFRQLEREDPALLAEVKKNALKTYANMYNKQYDTNHKEEYFA